MKCKQSFVITIFILIGSLVKAGARRGFEYQRPIWSLGMGGVYTPFPKEEDMPTANAAFLAKVTSINIELINIFAGAPGLEAMQDLQSLPPISSIADLNNYMGKTIWTALDGRFSLVGPNFGLSLYNNFYLKSYFSNPLMPEWDLDFNNDSGLTLSGAVTLAPHLSLGLGLKRITRWGGEKTIGFDLIDQYIQTQNSDLILDQFQDKGIGYGADLSLLFRPDSGSVPTATLVWKDVGFTSFQKTAGSQAPPHIRDNLILGLGYNWDWPGLDTKLGFEYRNITTPSMQFGKKLHLGAEFSLPLVDLRMGLSQGYMTYGLGLDLLFFRFDLAQYTVEGGTYPGQSPDQRLQMGLSINLEVDADFNITSKDGKKRKLKQRR